LTARGLRAQIGRMVTISEPAADRTAGGAPSWLGRLLAARRPAVMGILNLTPDSFSDGGRFVDPAVAIAHARQMIADGADIIDIGAESTRPYGGAVRVNAAEEQRRLAPVLGPVCALGTPVSIDSMKAEVADWALRQGAAMVNDVWGLQRDPELAAVVARHGVPVVVMHNRDAADPEIDIMADIDTFLARSLAIARSAGIVRERIVLDPGIGFGKTPQQSIEVLARLDRLKSFGLPLLVGASRKRFIDSVSPAPPDRRIGGSIAAHLLSTLDGAAILRVHDVAETVQALRVAAAIRVHATPAHPAPDR
jgi:dihydropteroate synthase